MFVQVIRGKAADQEGLERQGERWQAELAPGATGWLGSTGGIADDGTVVLFARFDSAASARANSDRPEQGAWWTETEKCFDGAPTFEETEDVDQLLGGGSNDAGFVQVMTGSADRDRLHRMDALFERAAPSFRPDVLGGLRAWVGPDRYVEAIYFTSEEAARAGESAEPPEEVRAAMAADEDLFQGVEFLDLRRPWLQSP